MVKAFCTECVTQSLPVHPPRMAYRAAVKPLLRNLYACSFSVSAPARRDLNGHVVRDVRACACGTTFYSHYWHDLWPQMTKVIRHHLSRRYILLSRAALRATSRSACCYAFTRNMPLREDIADHFDLKRSDGRSASPRSASMRMAASSRRWSSA